MKKNVWDGRIAAPMLGINQWLINGCSIIHPPRHFDTTLLYVSLNDRVGARVYSVTGLAYLPKSGILCLKRIYFHFCHLLSPTLK
jgi:hypothetical protein